VAVLGKYIWGAWPLIIWEGTTAKRNYYRTNQKFGGPGQDLGGLCPPGPSLKPPLNIPLIFDYKQRLYLSSPQREYNFVAHLP